MVLKVLIADDDPAAAAYLKKTIEEVPEVEVVSTANDGKETIRQVSLDADPPAAAVQQHCHPNFSSPSPLSKIDVRGRKSDVENHQETLTLVPQHYLTSATFSSSFHLQLMPPGRHGHLLKSPSLIPACEVCHHILLDLLLN
jgi:DNA-binding NarL/FixJ family response regulator